MSNVYAKQAIGCLVAAHVPCLAGMRVWKAEPAYTPPMHDRLGVILEDATNPGVMTYSCVLQWPRDFVQRPRPLAFKLKATEAAAETKRSPFKIKGR